MKQTDMTLMQCTVVEESLHLSLLELCQACSADAGIVTAWVFEGVLEPVGSSPQDWHFGGDSLRRARQALRLSRDLEINPPGVALALDLLDEIAALRAQLRRTGVV